MWFVEAVLKSLLDGELRLKPSHKYQLLATTVMPGQGKWLTQVIPAQEHAMTRQFDRQV